MLHCTACSLHTALFSRQSKATTTIITTFKALKCLIFKEKGKMKEIRIAFYQGSLEIYVEDADAKQTTRQFPQTKLKVGSF